MEEMRMSDIKIIQGEIFRDARGQISSLNHFRFAGINRVYFIHHPDVSIIRGWHGHKLEKKWFYCVKGAFTIGLIEIDNWSEPSRNLKPDIMHISELNSQIICIPEGFASCIQAEQPDSTLMVLSGKTLDEAMAVPDSYRYDCNYWGIWNEIKQR